MRNLIITSLLTLSMVAVYAQTCDLESEGFENGGSDPIGWTRVNSYNGTTAPNNGTYHAGFNTDNDAYISDTYGCPDEICYYWRTSGGTSNFTIDVQWSDNGGGVWNTFESFNTIDSSSITTYRRNCLDLSAIAFGDPSNVSFRFLQYNRVGGSWYLDDVCISSGGATQLAFTSIPTGCNLIGTNLATTVCAVDDCGNVDNSYAGSITLTKSSGSGSLSGTTTLSATSGCASFTDLQFDTQDNYTMLANDGSLTNTTSGLIEIKSSCPTVDTFTIVTYNLLNFPNSLGSCDNYVSNRVDTLKKIMKYINPDVLMVCELQDAAGADLILNSALNVDGVTKYAKATFVQTVSSGDNTHNNMFYYNSDKMVLQSQDAIKTDLRDLSEYIVYGIDPNLGTHNDTTYIDFYETHLKAGDPFFNLADSVRRIEEADSIRQYIDSKPAGANNIMGGDFNFYTDNEEAYQVLCYQGTNPFVDPIATEGDWNNNNTYAAVHTQSTRSGGGADPDYDCGAKGGNDDRFDFLLTSGNVLSGVDGVTYVPGTYTALGNNGTTFNGDINSAGNTSAIPDNILNALFYMSDHLPVIMKVAIEYPAISMGLDTIDEVDKIESIEAIAEIKIYPNPSPGVFYVDLGDGELSVDSKIIITNILGEVIFEMVQLKEQNIYVDMSNFKSGMYFVNLINNLQVVKSKKLILK